MTKWQCELLGGFDQSGPEAICFNKQPFYSEGFVVRFTSSDGDIWVGNFPKCEFLNGEGAYSTNRDDRFYIFGEGLFIIDPNTREIIKEIGYGFQNLKQTSEGTIVANDYADIYLIYPDLKVFQINAATDGFKNVRLEGDMLTGYVDDYFYDHEPTSFSFDIKTKKLVRKMPDGSEEKRALEFKITETQIP